MIRIAIFYLIVGISVILLILSPISYLFATGVSNLSNDYVGIISVVNSILDGTYHWQHFFQDTFYTRSHLLVLPTLIHISVAAFAEWNVYVELYVGILMLILRLCLYFDAFTYWINNHVRWILLIPLTALVFIRTQISTLEFGMASVQDNLNLLGVALGIWGLVRFSNTFRGVWLAALGGTIASWSLGSGPLVWPLFFVGMMILPYRRLRHYVVLVTVAVLASFPYFYFLIISPLPAASSDIELRLPSRYIVQSIGWVFTPTTNGLPPDSVFSIGLVGLILAGVGTFLTYARQSRLVTKRALPALMLITSGILTAWQVGLARDSIAPWYISYYIPFWSGLLGLAFILWVDATQQSNRSNGNLSVLSVIPTWSVAVVAIMIYLYFQLPSGYEPYSFYMYSRRPVSASCLRHFRTAPTFCEGYLFQWGVGTPEQIARLAEPLEAHHLSVFSSHQRWTLQGEYILDNVLLYEEGWLPPIYWSSDLQGTAARWDAPQHLNLVAHAPQSISWTIILPQNAESATFHSAIALLDTEYSDAPDADGVDVEIQFETADHTRYTVFSESLDFGDNMWQPFTLNLDNYRGQTITLYLMSHNKQTVVHDWLVYRYPYIDVVLDTDQAVEQLTTDSATFNPQPTDMDFRFDVADLSRWQIANMTPIVDNSALEQSGFQDNDNAAAFIIEGADPTMSLMQPLDICLADYTHFYLQMSTSVRALSTDPDSFRQYARIGYQLNHQDVWYELAIPLYFDTQLHTYTYPLRLLDTHRRETLTGIRLSPVRNRVDNGSSWVQIADLRLIHRDGASHCTD